MLENNELAKLMFTHAISKNTQFFVAIHILYNYIYKYNCLVN